MNGIQQFLEVYRKRLFAAEDERHAVLEAIFRVSGVKLSEHEVTIKRGVLTVHARSVVRNQLFLHQTKILEEINKTAKKPIAEIH